MAGAACAVFVDLKFKFGFDDSLDVVGVHLGGGLIGTLALGFIALPVDGAGGGLFYGGGLHQVIAQAVAVLITVAVSGLGTAVIGLAIHKTLGFRVSREDELAGVDRSEHAETAYAFAELGFSRFNPFGHHTGAAHAAHGPRGDVGPRGRPGTGKRIRTRKGRQPRLSRPPGPAQVFPKGPGVRRGRRLKIWAGGTRISELA